MKYLIRDIIIKIIIAVAICAILSLILSMIMPVLSNDIALDQLENTDTSFMQMEYRNIIQDSFTIVQYIVICVCCILIGADVYQIIKIKYSKENKR